MRSPARTRAAWPRWWLVMALPAGLLVSSASGDLTIHLRLAETPTVNGGSVALTGPGQVVAMQIWAVVTDRNGDPSDDGLWKFYSSFRSSDGGVMLGDLTTAWPTTPGGSRWGGGPASLGYQNDLEGEIDMSAPSHPGGYPDNPNGRYSDYHFIPGSGDGDLDIGHTDRSMPAPPWFLARSPSFVYDDGMGNPTNEWHVANLYFVATGWGPDYNPTGESGVTEIWAQPRYYAGAQWVEDGAYKQNRFDPGETCNGTLLGGASILLYAVPTAPTPEPATLALLVVGLGMLAARRRRVAWSSRRVSMLQS